MSNKHFGLQHNAFTRNNLENMPQQLLIGLVLGTDSLIKEAIERIDIKEDISNTVMDLARHTIKHAAHELEKAEAEITKLKASNTEPARSELLSDALDANAALEERLDTKSKINATYLVQVASLKAQLAKLPKTAPPVDTTQSNRAFKSALRLVQERHDALVDVLATKENQITDLEGTVENLNHSLVEAHRLSAACTSALEEIGCQVEIQEAE